MVRYNACHVNVMLFIHKKDNKKNDADYKAQDLNVCFIALTIHDMLTSIGKYLLGIFI